MDYSDRYNRCFSRLMQLEGGSTITSPAFDGHWTRYGIIQETYQIMYQGSVKDCTEEQAKALYHKLFWTPCNLDSVINESICMFIFAGAVNMGYKTYVRNCVQYPLCLIADGVIGKQTLAKLNYDTPHVYSVIYKATEDRYRQIAVGNKAKLLKGWIARIKKIPYQQ